MYLLDSIFPGKSNRFIIVKGYQCKWMCKWNCKYKWKGTFQRSAIEKGLCEPVDAIHFYHFEIKAQMEVEHEKS